MTMREKVMMREWGIGAAACAVFLALQMLAGSPLAQPTPEPALAPVHNAGGPDTIPNQYIVVFKPGTSRETVVAAQNIIRRLDGRVGFTYTSALIGFSATLPAQALNALRAAPGIEFIEADQKVTVDTVQANPSAGLDRTSERLLPLDNRYTYSETGTGVHVYVVDRGIDSTHSEFAGRTLGNSVTFVNDGLGFTDCPVSMASGVVGHGTFVAGIIGGATAGIAKDVTLHSVRVADCTGSVSSNAVLAAGIDWVRTNAVRPAIANVSIGSGFSSAINIAVTNTVAVNITVVVSAGNAKMNACQRSPASAPDAITVGAVDPASDTLWQNPTDPSLGSNFGPCVDLFAPGFNIRSADISSSLSFRLDQGTSFAAPHVAGVAARFLQGHPMATPAQVMSAIHAAANVFGTTLNWAGISNLPANTVNELLHWGSLNDGFNDGDPHLTTVDGIHYDFQSAGEFIALRDGNGTEIQTRQTPVSTGSTVTNPYTGLAVGVSLNTAVAARVGAHRVTYQPNPDGEPDPAGLQLRVDGILQTLGQQGLDLGPGGRVAKAPAGTGIEVDFPDGTILIVSSNWWADQRMWYLNLSVFHTPARDGLMGSLAPNSWLPALANGTALGPMPVALHQRYVDLYETFADSWRVTGKTSLFDYARGTSTSTFTLAGWPRENPPFVLPQHPPLKPLSEAAARKRCQVIVDKQRRTNCVFDVRVTGHADFVKAYQVSEKIQAGATSVALNGDQPTTQVGEEVTFTATVTRLKTNDKGFPTGTIQFTLDGAKVGGFVKLDAKGRATWETTRLKVGEHRIAALYMPGKNSPLLPSGSLEQFHTVKRCFCEDRVGAR